jgi:hypothetical protein
MSGSAPGYNTYKGLEEVILRSNKHVDFTQLHEHLGDRCKWGD